MAVNTKAVLKTYFETGDVPTEAQFESLIDSLQHVNDEVRVLNFAPDGTFEVPAGKVLTWIGVKSNAAQTIKIGTLGAGTDNVLYEQTVTNGQEISLMTSIWANLALVTVYVTATDIDLTIKETVSIPLT